MGAGLTPRPPLHHVERGSLSSVISAQAGIQAPSPRGRGPGGRGGQPTRVAPTAIVRCPASEPARLRQVVEYQVDDPPGSDDVEPHGQGDPGEAAMQPEVAAEGERDGSQDKRPHDDRQDHV